MKILENENMGKYTTFKCGGNAKVLYIPDSKEELIKLLKDTSKETRIIIGNGSNVLCRDGGYDGIIIKIKNYDKIEIKGNEIIVDSGTALSKLANVACEHSLTGLEFAAGIPGSVGGAVFMNAGAYGSEIKDVLKEITVCTCEGNIKTISADKLKLAYRYSILKETKDIVINATFKLEKGNKEIIKNTMKELNEQRRTKQPLEYPSAGSTFKRPENNYAGKLIEDAGLKGKCIGGAEVSDKHAGFVINKNNATAADIEKLIDNIQKTVYNKFNVLLEPEVIIIGKN